MIRHFSSLMLASLVVLTLTANAQINGVKHVIILGVDGLSPMGVQQASTPAFNELLARGAFSFTARAVLGTSSSQNWASMIMGAGPEQHGITSNAWERNNHSIVPTTYGSGDIFPTVFSLMREQRPRSKIGVFYDWGGFGRLFEKQTVDVDYDGDGPKDTMEKAIAYLKSDKPELTFVHLDHVDHALHGHGEGSDEYILAVQTTDSLLKDLMDGLNVAGMLSETVLIITSDHGGIGTRHGGESMEELEIPWIAYGPQVKAGKEITDPINTYDTAVTAAFILGLKPSYHWIGRPVVSAFQGYDDQAGPLADKKKYVPMPRIWPNHGVVESLSAPLTLTVDHKNAEIRYTMDGSEPTPKSSLYKSPITINQPGTVKARSFIGDEAVSRIASATFLSEKNGIRYEYFEGKWDSLPDFASLTSLARGQVNQFGIENVSNRGDWYGIRLHSKIHIETAGEYTFYTLSDDGSKLYVNGREIVENDGGHGARERAGKLMLPAGAHEILVTYFETYGDNTLRVLFEGPGIAKQQIPAVKLFLPESQ